MVDAVASVKCGDCARNIRHTTTSLAFSNGLSECQQWAYWRIACCKTISTLSHTYTHRNILDFIITNILISDDDIIITISHFSRDFRYSHKHNAIHPPTLHTLHTNAQIRAHNPLELIVSFPMLITITVPSFGWCARKPLQSRSVCALAHYIT